jgi:two-component system sensor histidine kinase MprB
MTLRARITLLVAVAVALAVAGITGAAYLSARGQLHHEVDEFLLSRVGVFENGGQLEIEGLDDDRFEEEFGPPRRGDGDDPGAGRGDRRLSEFDTEVQVVLADGTVLPVAGQVVLPVSDDDRDVARSGGEASLRTVEVDGVDYRLATAPTPFGGVVQVARELTETEAAVSGVGLRLFAVGGAGVVLAALVGWIVAGRAIAPVGRLTNATEHVAETQDLGEAIDVERSDEIGRLASSFNTMLAALDTSRGQQRRLVMDASHELRTPLTSLRTNIEVLARSDSIAPSERAALLSDITFELEELSSLVTELVELATDTASEEPVMALRLDDMAEDVAQRSRRRTGRSISLSTRPSTIEGRRSQLERAMGNLVDNADKWGAPGTPIEMSVSEGRVEVRDHGPGIEPGDAERIFDRFYRASDARTKPGSGLGLAIVKQIIENHGGTVYARNADDGGALVGFDVPETA